MKKTFKGYRVVMALLIALLVMSSIPMFAFAAEGDEAQNKTVWGNEEKHTLKDNKGYLIEPTEKEVGYEMWTCDDPEHVAQNIVHLMEVPKVKHTHDWKATVTLASCEEGGTLVEKCSKCGEERTRTISPTGHTFLDDTFTFTDLTDKDGKVIAKEYYVEIKDVDFTETDAKKLKEAIDKLEEDYGLVIDTNPTCQTEGTAHFVCTVCGKSSKIYSIAPVPAAHVWVEKHVIREATCKSAGLEGRWCRICSAYENPTIIMNADTLPDGRLKPKYDIKSVDNVTDCYTTTFTIQCVNCAGKVHPDVKNVSAEQLPAYGITKAVGTAHEFKQTVANIDFAKSSKNIDEAKTNKAKKIVLKNCEVETEVFYKCVHWDGKHGNAETDWQKVTLPVGKHTWGAWKEVHAPTDTDAGYYIRSCTVCGTQQGADGSLVNVEGDKETPSVMDATYEIDMTNVTVDGAASGAAEVKVVEGVGDASKLFGRITFVYELADGQSHAVAVRAYVDEEDGKCVIKVGGAQTPSGATLKQVQVALVSDKDAYLKAEYGDSFLAGGTK